MIFSGENQAASKVKIPTAVRGNSDCLQLAIKTNDDDDDVGQCVSCSNLDFEYAERALKKKLSGVP